MNENTEQLIDQGLRDLHLPQAIGWWPLAPGWWAIGMLMIIIAATAAWQLQRYRRLRDPRRRAVVELRDTYQQWLKHGNASTYYQQSHRVLRQLAIQMADRASVSRLAGERWVNWLDERVEQPLSVDARHALAVGGYRLQCADSIQQLHAEYVRWASTCRRVTHA